MISLPRRDIFSQSDSLEHACLPETNSRGRSKQSARLIALVGNEWAPGSLGKQPAAHFPSPCSAGYPGRSREWLRPRLFGGSPRQFSGACLARPARIRFAGQRLPYHQNARTRRARGDRGKCRTNSSLRENFRCSIGAKSRN